MAVPGSRHWAAASQSRTAEQKGNPVCARFPKALLTCRTEPWGKVRWWRLNSLSCKSLLTHRLSQYLVPSRVATRVYHKAKRKVVLLLGLMRPHHQLWLIRASNRRGKMQPRKSGGGTSEPGLPLQQPRGVWRAQGTLLASTTPRCFYALCLHEFFFPTVPKHPWLCTALPCPMLPRELRQGSVWPKNPTQPSCEPPPHLQLRRPDLCQLH